MRNMARRVIVATVAVAALLALAGCGGSSGAGSGGGSAGGSSSPTAPPSAQSTAAATAAISQAYQTFFSPSSSVAERADVLQDGQRFLPTIQQFVGVPLAKAASAKVTKVTLTDSTQAAVTYDISEGGNPVLPNASGQAVKQNGAWKVADSTLCGLISLGGLHSSACGG